MQKFVALIAALGMVVAFGSAALAGGTGECSYGSHNQAAIDKADATKAVATKSPDKADNDKVTIAKTEKPASPTAAVQK